MKQYRQGARRERALERGYGALNGGNVMGAHSALLECIAQDQADAEAIHLLGLLAWQAGDRQAALRFFQQAVMISPDTATYHSNLGSVLAQLGRVEEALIQLRTAVQNQPALADAHYNLARTLQEVARYSEAVTSFRQATTLRPEWTEAWYGLAHALSLLGDLRPARDAAVVVLEHDPQHSDGLALLLSVAQQLAEWPLVERISRSLQALLAKAPATPIPPFPLLSLPFTAAEQQERAREWACRVAPVSAPGRRKWLLTASSSADRPVRIGYLSADFRQHPVGELIVEVLELHDRSRVSVFGYALSISDGSALHKRIRVACDQFIELHGCSDDQAAARIESDELDILVDLGGFTEGARPGILARRPAPVQVNFLGYPGTMGAAFIDYIIADRYLIPPELQRYYSERVAYLPHCFQPNDRWRPISEQLPTREVVGLDSSQFVYCCFNNLYKITGTLFDTWMRILKAVPQAVLWMKVPDTQVQESLRAIARGHGLEPERLIFAARTHSPAEHRARYPLADLFLDTLPYNAHATASEALWSGLPVLTCVGESYASRVGGSLLHAVSLPELVTQSPEEYEARAIALATSDGELTTLRQRLCQGREYTPLFDTPAYVRDLEDLYCQMIIDLQQLLPATAEQL